MTLPAPATLSAAVAAPRAPGMPPGPPQRPPVSLKWLRRLLWLYLALWLCEGGLRKWVLPGLASPLLVVRDPILLLMYALALQKGVFPRSRFVFWIAGVGAAAVVLSLIGSRAPLVVQAFGFRADFLHLPLVFLIPNLFDRDDVRRVGQWTLLSALPMSLLVLLQFRSPATARVNVGVGGEGLMLDAGFGHIRASGTFSFTNGLTDFTALCLAFCLYSLLVPKAFPRLLRWSAPAALAGLILLSASRGVVGLVVIVFSTTLLISLLQPRYLGPTLKIIGVCLLVALLVGSVAVFQDGLEVFAYRFGNAANVREGFVGRFFSSFLIPFELFDQVDFYGVGLGMGTNVAAGLQFEGQRRILLSESELGRVMFESGPLVGSAFLLLRAVLVLFLFGQALRALRRDAHPLSLLLLGACGVEMILGAFGQATTLGYVTIACGLCLAASRPGASEAATALAGAAVRPARPLPPLPPAPRPVALPGGETAGVKRSGDVPPAPAAPPARMAPRGRSLYAEQMHREAEEERRVQEAARKVPGEQAGPPE